MLQVRSKKNGDASKGADDTANAVELLHTQWFSYYMEGSHNGITGTYFQHTVSWCCDILEAKDISCILHGTRVQGPFAICLVLLNAIQYLTTGQVRTVTTEAKEGQKT